MQRRRTRHGRFISAGLFSLLASSRPAAATPPLEDEHERAYLDVFQPADMFQCHHNVTLPAKYPITPEEAEANKCCITLPCKYERGCWAGQVPPLYSQMRTQTFTKEQMNHLEKDWLLPQIHSGATERTSAPSMPDHSWFRIPVPRDSYAWLYDGISESFTSLFNATLHFPIDIDAFYIDKFDESWTSDITYESLDPGAGFWIHEDCSNFRICFQETGIPAANFTGDGVAFVVPVALPSPVDYKHGHTTMPAGLELYNISHGYRDENGKLLRPQNREWGEVNRFNQGEILFWNAFRWHSGHVPRIGGNPVELNPDRKFVNAVGFAGKLADTGDWVLFRMCKGSTDDKVEEKILSTDNNNVSRTGAKGRHYSDEELELAAQGDQFCEWVPGTDRETVCEPRLKKV